MGVAPGVGGKLSGRGPRCYGRGSGCGPTEQKLRECELCSPFSFLKL